MAHGIVCMAVANLAIKSDYDAMNEGNISPMQEFALDFYPHPFAHSKKQQKGII